MKKVVIIGAGFGGLSLGLRLQARGYEVTVLDKQSQPGGHAVRLQERGYTFDMGPSLITAPELIEELFRLAGKRMEDYLTLVPLDPYYRIYFWDGSFLDYTGDAERMKAQIAALSPGEEKAYDAFMERSRQFYKAVIIDGLGERPFTWRELWKFLPQALRLGAFRSSYSLAARYFRDERLRFTFSFHPLFIGGDPFLAPAVYQMIPYLEKTGGVWYAYGGMHAVAEALAKVFQEIGGTLFLETEAEEIRVRNGRAYAVRSSKGEFPADIVVSNADYYHTFTRLLPEPYRLSPFKKQMLWYSMSAFILYLGVRRTYPERLPHHTIALGPRYKGLVKDIFRRKVLAEDFSLYLHVPTRTEAGMAPPGSESLYVLSPVPNLQAKIDWAKAADTYAEKIIRSLEERIGLKGLRDSIEVRAQFTPEDFMRERNCGFGAAWGPEPVLWQTAVLRPSNRHKRIPNLFLVGAGTHPGAGVPGVLLSAKATERALVEAYPLSSRSQSKLYEGAAFLELRER
ncbi:MAG: phytoene desaturase family protein [Bacteroidia bacterium]|nr:phytoene desaturase family protein [Bacteroidia bacterium]MDW8056732.1 phytoene desaturase family protein [Bacteroidia bacterium]